MIIDVHAHIFPDAIAEKASAHIAKFYDIPMNADGKLSTLLTMEKDAGVDKILLCSAATTAHQTMAINDFTAQTVATHPGVLYGLAAMHQDFIDKGKEIERVRALGLKGVKIHPDIQGVAMNDPRFDELYEALSQYEMPLLAHTGDMRYHNSNPPEFIDVLTRFPRLIVIGAHLGCWSNWSEGVKVLAKYKNVYVDCSSSLYALMPEQAKQIFHGYGVERVLFGTDYPMWTPKVELTRLHALGLTHSELECVLYKNAQGLLGID